MRYRYGPHVIDDARFLAGAPYTTEHHIAVLHEVNRRWPGLSFSDFIGAVVLAEAAALQPEGRA
jgi:hypothetical protein